MTADEIQRAWLLVNKYGPPNGWTAANGTLAGALGRALEEIERLQYRLAMVENRRGRMAPRIIGLAGAAGAGKNTVGEVLFAEGYANFGFADPLYQAVSAITGVPEQSLRNREAKERPIDWLGKSPRELLQTLGTEWGRGMVRDDIWIRIAMRQAKALLKYGVNACITDVRFTNEAEAIRAGGGQVWLVKRRATVLVGGAAKHSSEAGIPPELVDAVVDNDGTIEELTARVKALLVVK